MNDFLSMSNRGVRAAGKAGTGSTWLKFSDLLHLHVTSCRCRCSGERSGNTGNVPYALDFCGGNGSTFCIWLVTSGSSGHLWMRGPIARRLAPEWMTALSHPLLPRTPRMVCNANQRSSFPPYLLVPYKQFLWFWVEKKKMWLDCLPRGLWETEHSWENSLG